MASRFSLIFTDCTGVHVITATNEPYPLNVLTTIALALQSTGAASFTKILETIPDGAGVILRQHSVWSRGE
jgi:hypothetical protein